MLLILENRSPSDIELSLMTFQPPKEEYVKNYYALDAKTKSKKYQEPKKKHFQSKFKEELTTIEPRILDGYFKRSDNTEVIADESNNVYISARPVETRPFAARLTKEDLNTGEYLPDSDFFVIDAKDFGEKEPPIKQISLTIPDSDRRADQINNAARTGVKESG